MLLKYSRMHKIINPSEKCSTLLYELNFTPAIYVIMHVVSMKHLFLLEFLESIEDMFIR